MDPAKLQKFREAAISQGYKPKEVDDYIQKKQQQKAVEALVQKGAIDINKVAESDPVNAQRIIEKNPTIKATAELSTADKKNKDALTSVNNLLNNLEKHYQDAGGGSFGSGPIARIKGGVTNVAGNLGLNDSANVYNSEKEGFAATLKSLTGDTGVLTDQDYARLSKLLPGLGSTPKEAKSLLNDLRSQVSAKYGGEATKTTINPEEKAGPSGNPLIDFLLGGAINVAKDVGTGIRSAKTQPILERQNQQAQAYEQESTQTLDPMLKKILLKQANDVRQGISTEAQDISESFSPDVNRDPLSRGGQAALEITSAAGIPSFLKGVSNIPKVVKGAGGKVFPQAAGSTLRQDVLKTAESSGKAIDGSKIVSNVQEWAARAKKANPASGKSIDKYVAGITDQFKDKAVKPSEAFNLWEDASKGYTAAGTKGASLESSYHRATRDFLRKELDAIAPGFEEGTKMIRTGLGRSKYINKIGSGVAYGVPTTIASAILLNYLMGKNKQ